MSPNVKIERNVLAMSVIGAVAFSFAGIFLGILSGSHIVLFDGLYSMIIVALSYLSLAAAVFMGKNDEERFPFGKNMVEPLVILFKYSVILLLVILSLLSAVHAVFTGGRDVAVGIALLYAALGTAACYGYYLYLNKHAKKTASGLIKAEANQWLMDTLITAGVLAGFILASVFQYIPALNPWVPYVDPVMLILVSVYFLKYPVREMRTALKEVLEMKPDKQITSHIDTFVAEAEERFKLAESFVRVTKIGRTLWVEIDFVVQPDSKVQTVKDQDRVREMLNNKLLNEDSKLWLTIAFTSDRKWAL
ncbi:cation diffusion facilitator family transporter [Salisediminibacterium halotolerans]|uniref:Cation diffusion facilitator family transporter n=1 Tax=Salisediminibacterium halotolerans TaxID=517425 RepID=A0A1H9V2M7_9BACI|nr:cation diffusion facilitator family transporter [Salisediminibacterium haloalkalitolerans]SES15819.1 cation diffusion facilitator family transporter [Salisediminibacterium haloalkalitolerans]